MNDIVFDSEDDEEFWEELYNENYDSPLEKVDEVEYFENCIQQIKQDQNGFYN